MKHGLKYKLTILVSLLLLSCQRNELVPSEAMTDAITFSLSSNAGYSVSTRAADESFVLISEDGTDSLLIQLSEAPYCQDAVITKGTPVTTSNLKSYGEDIAVRAFYNKDQFINDVFVFDEDGRSARTSIASYWPVAEKAKVDFWSFHPKEIAQTSQPLTISNDESTPSLSFYYNQEKADVGGVLVAATDQKDMFMAYARQGKEDGPVGLHYIHALSAIKFQAGKALSGTIINIEISNVCAGGTLTYSPNGTDKLIWNLDNKKYCTLSQDFTRDIKEDFTGDVSQGITKDIDSTVFMLIPQPLAEKELTIKYRRDGATEAKSYKVNLLGEKWEPGKTYTYTLRLMDGLGVDVETSTPTDPAPPSTSVIGRMSVKNTYNKTSYIRTMIIGNWVDEDGNIAAIFDPDEVDLQVSGENYQLSDYWYHDTTTNIYYYKNPLPKTEYTENLLITSVPSVQHPEGLKLDIVVLVQAVEAEGDKASVRAAWGDIADEMEPVAGN